MVHFLILAMDVVKPAYYKDKSDFEVIREGYFYGTDNNSKTCSRCGINNPNYVEPHTHSYKETATAAGADCKHYGTVTYTCSCGDSYTENNSVYGSHSWVTGYKTVHHNESYRIGSVTYCSDCGDRIATDVNGTGTIDRLHAEATGCSGYTYSKRNEKIIDKQAWDEEVLSCYCSVCGVEQE